VAVDVSAGAQQERPEPPPWTGPWADDARRLFQLLQTAAEQAGPAPSGSPGSDESADHEHPPECRYCPFCQGVALLRRAGPDVLDQVSEFAAGLAATLRATQPAPGTAPDQPADSADDASGASAGSSTGDRSSASARPPSTVRIDVTD
jgi:hypothetical protein